MSFRDVDVSHLGVQSSLGGEYTAALSSLVGDLPDGENFGFDITGLLERRVSVVGMEQVLRNWNALTTAVKTTAREITFDRASDLLRESQEEVPFLTGHLHDSGYIAEDHEGLDGGLEAFVVGYDASSAPYAWDQHENLDYTHAPGRKAKYLQDPFERQRDRYPAEMESELKTLISSMAKSQFSGGPRLVKKSK